MNLTQNVIKCLQRGGPWRSYSLSCPGRTPPGKCGCGGRQPAPPRDCRPNKIPYNPCCPHFHEGHDTYKKYKYIFLLMLPVIIAHTLNCLSHCPHPKGECREYEYMLRRTKRFPWGEGKKSFFHNDETNHLPGDCTPAPLDCD
ncbi:cytochrome c oxidase subunit 6A, mitochondrial-like [Leguminivora glycinivorella]|uniref:cytochrome c oxidase subunit 6A, mitochondrial-like n=1 Tax=Leguminivora glycinivorella TaxID=1035111 RepID=UPI00200DBA66|nr:cytochrome c oxidase subunit 6A, mitochondrial-like [Leguminivora glycinivorella]